MGIIKTLNPVLEHHYRALHFDDFSGNSNDGNSNTSANLNREGANLNGTDEYVEVTDASNLTFGNGTTDSAFSISAMVNMNTKEFFHIAEKGTGVSANEYAFFHDSDGKMRFYVFDADDDNSISITATSVISNPEGRLVHMVATYDGSGTTGGVKLFADNVAVAGTPVETGTYVAMEDTATPVNIGKRASFSEQFSKGLVRDVTVFPSVLTTTQMSQIEGEYLNTTFPTKPYAKALALQYSGNENANEIPDGDMEKAGVADWSDGAGATSSKSTTNPKKGTQVLNVLWTGAGNDFTASNTLTSGKIYRTTGWARGDGVSSPSIRYGTIVKWTGTTSTEWQQIDFTSDTDSTAFRLYLESGGSVDWDDILVQEVGVSYFDVQFKTDWGVNVSTANITAGQLENSPFEVLTGTHKIETDTFNGRTVKVINPVVGGTLKLHGEVLNDSNWEMYINTGGGYALDTSPPIASNVITTTTAQKIILSDVGGNYGIIKFTS